MTKEDIIRMAREAGLEDEVLVPWAYEINMFAALVAAAEREACAEFADEYMEDSEGKNFGVGKAIRARGETK